MGSINEGEESGVKPETKREDTMETETNASSNVSETADRTLLSDGEALARAKEHFKRDQVLVAARLLENIATVPDEDIPFKKEVEEKAKLLNHVIADLLSDPEQHTADDDNHHDKWIKGGESHDGHRDTIMYYKLSEEMQLTGRLETPIESSLLVPLLSVLIETDLYMTWLPRWTVPRVGIASVKKLAQLGRTDQILQFISEVPWPFTARDVILKTCATDDIDDVPEDPNTTGAIVIGLVSLEQGETIHKSTLCNPHYETGNSVVEIPPVAAGLKRAEFDGGLLIRKCPDDHVALRHSKVNYPPDEHLILVGFSMRIDGKISPLFPAAVINFVIQVSHVRTSGFVTVRLPTLIFDFLCCDSFRFNFRRSLHTCGLCSSKLPKRSGRVFGHNTLKRLRQRERKSMIGWTTALRQCLLA
jgi:hypothetical protein